MVFNSSNRLIKNTNFKLNNQEITAIREFCYLGTIFTPNGKFKLNHAMLKNRAMKSSFSISQTVLTQNNISVSLCLKVFDQLVSPILVYGAEVWAHEITNVCSHFYRFILV